MVDRIVLWAIKRLVFFWDRNGDKMAFCFSKDERTEYNILVARYNDDGYTYGTAKYSYVKEVE